MKENEIHEKITDWLDWVTQYCGTNLYKNVDKDVIFLIQDSFMNANTFIFLCI